jgi:inosose dehydratase
MLGSMTPARLATTPISWGVVGGGRWGVDLPTDRVLAEMSGLGFTASEIGVPSFLPADEGAARALLERHGIRAVAGAQSVVMHEPSVAADELSAVRQMAARLAGLGADVMMTVPKRGDLATGDKLDAQGWRRVFSMFDAIDDVLEEYGLVQALHPHVGSLVEDAADMAAVLDGSSVGWCFDTAHVASGGLDPVAFAATCPTINHFHLKDARIELGAAMVRHELGFADAIRQGVFVPLGEGDLPVADIVAAMAHRDDVWWVLEQDQAVAAVPPPGEGPSSAVERSLELLASLP